MVPQNEKVSFSGPSKEKVENLCANVVVIAKKYKSNFLYMIPTRNWEQVLHEKNIFCPHNIVVST